MTLWMKVTDDEFELPEAVADTPKELAMLIGVKPNNVSSAYCKAKAKGQQSVYQKVEVEDEND